jgi:hypothetical protein
MWCFWWGSAIITFNYSFWSFGKWKTLVSVVGMKKDEGYTMKKIFLSSIIAVCFLTMIGCGAKSQR